jgi:hypothetical protein
MMFMTKEYWLKEKKKENYHTKIYVCESSLTLFLLD